MLRSIILQVFLPTTFFLFNFSEIVNILYNIIFIPCECPQDYVYEHRYINIFFISLNYTICVKNVDYFKVVFENPSGCGRLVGK